MYSQLQSRDIISCVQLPYGQGVLCNSIHCDHCKPKGMHSHVGNDIISLYSNLTSLQVQIPVLPCQREH